MVRVLTIQFLEVSGLVDWLVVWNLFIFHLLGWRSHSTKRSLVLPIQNRDGLIWFPHQKRSFGTNHYSVCRVVGPQPRQTRGCFQGPTKDGCPYEIIQFLRSIGGSIILIHINSLRSFSSSGTDCKLISCRQRVFWTKVACISWWLTHNKWTQHIFDWRFFRCSVQVFVEILRETSKGPEEPDPGPGAQTIDRIDRFFFQVLPSQAPPALKSGLHPQGFAVLHLVLWEVRWQLRRCRFWAILVWSIHFFGKEDPQISEWILADVQSSSSSCFFHFLYLLVAFVSSIQ